jgi:transglutaminase-like putative cysteine protease
MNSGLQLAEPQAKRFNYTWALIRCAGVFLALTLPGHFGFADDEAPAWLRQAASATLPVYSKDVSAATLFHEQRVTVNEGGKVTTTTYGAVRILSVEGRSAAVARVVYETDTGKVGEMRGWVIRPSRAVKRIGKEQILDLAAVDNDVYNEVRIRTLAAPDDIEPGSVFGFETTSESRSVFTQFEWEFQSRLPALVSRFSLALPAGWRAESVTFNHSDVRPTITGSTYTWELRELPFIEKEPASPELSNLAPRLAVSYFPPPGTRAGIGRTFDNWVSVSRWLSELSAPQMELNEALVVKARELVKNAKNEYERIQAIGRYAQSVKYVSIQTGIGRGGGYRPHSAREVFEKAYGDCKDKANLMRALLRAVDISAFPVAIYSGDPTYVREQWPSPQQFNHCIIAVKVSDETQCDSVVQHPTLGRLLIFDPTDDNTPVGDLPDHEQGSLALLAAGDAGALLRMPQATPEANRLERQTEMTLAPDGSIAVRVGERSVGQSAVNERRLFRALSRPEYAKMIERWIARGANAASVSKIEPADDNQRGFALDVEFTVPVYGQLMQGRLLVFKPAVISQRESVVLTSASRKHPIVLEAEAYTETVRIKLPTGFVPDEVPDAANLQMKFGSYRAHYEVKDDFLLGTRTLVLRAGVIPVEQYSEVRGFFERIRASEQGMAVLVKK